MILELVLGHLSGPRVANDTQISVRPKPSLQSSNFTVTKPASYWGEWGFALLDWLLWEFWRYLLIVLNLIELDGATVAMPKGKKNNLNSNVYFKKPWPGFSK